MSYLPDIAWSTRVEDVEIASTPYHFYCTVNPLDPNDPGFGELEIGYILLDFNGYPFEVVGFGDDDDDEDEYRVEVYDINERGDGTNSAYAPYPDRQAYIYQPKNEGVILSQAQLRKLDRSAADVIEPIEKGVVWSHRGVEISGYDITPELVGDDNITKISLSNHFTIENEGTGWKGGKHYSITLDNLEHGGLQGLEGDDHEQYALLDGRTGDVLKIDEIQEYTTDAGITLGNNVDISGTLDMLDNSIANVNYIDFNTSYADGISEGRMQWNSEDGTVEIGLPGGNVNLQLGQEMLVRVKKALGVTVLNGQAVYISGASGQRPEVSLADADDYDKSFVLGIATESITGTTGYITSDGLVRDVNTGGMTEGDCLWLSQTPGAFTNVRPDAPAMSVFLGQVVYAHATEGVILVRPTVVPRLQGLSDVYGKTSDKCVPTWNSANNRFEFGLIGLADGVTGTLPVIRGGTGIAFYTAGDILYASGSTTLAKLAKGTDGQVLKLASGIPTWDDESSGGTPAGANTQVQFNDNGAFGADSDFTYDKTTNSLKITGNYLGANLETNATTYTTKVGVDAGLGENETAVRRNVFVGYQSGKGVTTGGYNTFVGNNSGYTGLTVSNATFIGYNSGYSARGTGNTFIGESAGRGSSIGAYNSTLGGGSGYSLSDGSYNTLIGWGSGYYTTGDSNTCIGFRSGYGLKTGIRNVYIGEDAGRSLNGDGNVLIGAETYTPSSGDYNVLIGQAVAKNKTGGSNNVFIGYQSGRGNTTGDDNVFIGNTAGYFETGSDKLFIDNQIRTDESTARTNSLIYGEFNSTATDQLFRVNGVLEHSLMPNKPKIYSQSAEPDIPKDSMAFWTDTDDKKYYLILDIGGTQKKVELT